MTRMTTMDTDVIARVLLSGGVVVLRTDTLYGVIARADDEAAVQRVYDVKGRNQSKSPIVLISDMEMVYDELSSDARRYCESVWPGKVSVIIPSQQAPEWIRRDNASVAYRLPDIQWLRAVISRVGPLVAPSANPEGQPPATTIDEAEEYFGDAVDLYVDGGRIDDIHPSQIIRLSSDGAVERLR